MPKLSSKIIKKNLRYVNDQMCVHALLNRFTLQIKRCKGDYFSQRNHYDYLSGLFFSYFLFISFVWMRFRLDQGEVHKGQWIRMKYYHVEDTASSRIIKLFIYFSRKHECHINIFVAVKVTQPLAWRFQYSYSLSISYTIR